MNTKRKLGLLAGLAAAALVTQTVQAGDVDIVFVVDESGSMAGEHAWIAGMVGALNTALLAAGANPRYGLVGFGDGGVGNAGRQVSVGGGQFGTSGQLATAAGTLATTGATEDGYAGINFGLGYSFRAGAAINFILVTDEDRDVVNAGQTYATTRNALNAVHALLNVVVNCSLNNGTNTNAVLGITGKTVLGPGGGTVDPAGKNYDDNGSGGFLLANGGRVAGADGTTEADYINMAFEVSTATRHGAAWDLNQLRAGGNTALSFTAAFVDLKVQEIIQQILPLPNAAWMGLAGLAGVGVIRRLRRKA